MFIAKQPLVTVTVRDETDSASVIQQHVRSTVDRDSGLSAAAHMRVIVEGISGATAERIALVYPFVEGAPAPAGAGSVHLVGVFLFATVEAFQYAIVEVPGLDPSHLVEEGPGAGLWIDQDDPTVAALVEELTSGLWCNPFGYQLTELAAAYMQVRDA